MRKLDLWEIYRRWQAGQTLSRIAANERRDRKKEPLKPKTAFKVVKTKYMLNLVSMVSG